MFETNISWAAWSVLWELQLPKKCFMEAPNVLRPAASFWAATTLACPISRVLLKCSIEMVYWSCKCFEASFWAARFLPACWLAQSQGKALNHFILLPTSCLVGVILELWRYNFSQKYFVFTFTLCFMIDWLLNWKSVQNSHIVKRASCPLPSINSLKESFLTKLW